MTAPVSDSALSELIGMIYDCAINPDRWHDTLSALRLELGFATATIEMVSVPKYQQLLSVWSGVDQHWLDKLPASAVDVGEMWGEAAMRTASTDAPSVLTWINPTAATANSPYRFYQEWGRPQGLIDIMAMPLMRDRTTVTSLSMGRHESAGPITPREVDMGRLLMPHLKRAVTITRLLDIKTMVSSTFQTVLDTLAAPVLLTDAALRVLHVNHAAQAMLERGDPLLMMNNVLKSAVPGVTQALAVAVKQSATDESALGRKGYGIPVRYADGNVGALHVLPLRYGKARSGLTPSAAAAIFLSSSATVSSVTPDVVAALFDLTPTEARVFGHVTAGYTTTETAHVMGVNISTIRAHLLRVYEKTGLHRQSDLVRMAASLASPG